MKNSTLETSIIPKLTEKRVKTITALEVRSVFSLATDDEIELIASAIRSSSEARIKAAIEMPVFRITQEKIKCESDK